MGSTISIARKVVVIPAKHWAGESILAGFELTAESNCFVASGPHSGANARSWHCVKLAGQEYNLVAEVVKRASACCGGMLYMRGHRDTQPEQYIKAWRKAIAEKQTMEECRRSFPLEFRFTFQETDFHGKPREYIEMVKKDIIAAGVELKQDWQKTWCGAWNGPLEAWAKIVSNTSELRGWECITTHADEWGYEEAATLFGEAA